MDHQPVVQLCFIDHLEAVKGEALEVLMAELWVLVYGASGVVPAGGGKRGINGSIHVEILVGFGEAKSFSLFTIKINALRLQGFQPRLG